MEVPNYFKDFLKSIRPQNRDTYIEAHKKLRTLLSQDKSIEEFYVATFLQGSYRRATAIEPEDGKKGDVDVVVVTTLDHNVLTPRQAMNRFTDFLEEHYEGKWVPQTRAIKIDCDDIDLDLVITAIPKEEADMYRSNRITESYTTPDDEETWEEFRKLTEKTNEWKSSPLKIPDRATKEWEDTHPLEQLFWTWSKNAACGRHYVNIVKALKFWKRHKLATPKYPKAYPLEHLIGIHCPDGVEAVAQGVTEVLESIASSYSEELSKKIVPFLPDHGVPGHNVFARLSFEDFQEFHNGVREAAKDARAALDSKDMDESVSLWKKLFGEQFDPDDDSDRGGFSKRTHMSSVSSATYG